LADILTALPSPESDHPPQIPDLISPPLSRQASPSPPSITLYESVRTQYKTVESVKSIASAGSPNEQEDRNPSHDETVGDKLRELALWVRGGDVRHVIMLGVLSIILYHVCKACMYLAQVQVEDVV
jgi:hypothetical protein